MASGEPICLRCGQMMMDGSEHLNCTPYLTRLLPSFDKQIITELRALRVEVDRLHQRMDDDKAEYERAVSERLKPATDDEIKYMQAEQLRVWSGVMVQMRNDMRQMLQGERELEKGQGLRS